MTERPSALSMLLVTLWARAHSWPPAARARLPEVRALALHHGLPCPAREHDALQPAALPMRRLLEAAVARGELRWLQELAWALELLVRDLELAEEALRRAQAALEHALVTEPARRAGEAARQLGRSAWKLPFACGVRAPLLSALAVEAAPFLLTAPGGP